MKLYKLIKRPPFFLNVSHWIGEDDRPIKSGKNAREPVIIPLLLMQYGRISKKFQSLFPIRHYFVSSIKGLHESAQSIKSNPKTGKKHIDEQTLLELEAYAKQLGIADIGYAKVNPDFIFKGFEILYDNAMVVTMEMNKEIIQKGNGNETTEEIFRTYAALGKNVNKISEFLRARGYNCHPSPAIGGDVNLVPLAQAANLGAVGKNGILITPKHGPCVRLAAVFIDVDNLPFAEKNEHMWISEFCETCNNCVKKCPGKAIYREPKILPDGTGRFIDLEKCALPFSEGCSDCIKNCVFINGRYEQIKKAFKHRK